MKFILFRKRSLLFSFILVIILAVTLIVGQRTNLTAIWSGKNILDLPICSVDTSENNVAISFDISLGKEEALKIHEILEVHDATATFFISGFWAQEYPQTLTEITASGRVEIGTSGNNHRDMTKLSKLQIKTEIKTSLSIIEGITENRVKLFRAPYGLYSNTLIKQIDSFKLYPVGHSFDSKGHSSSDIANKVTSKAKKGSIILLRAEDENTIEALPAIIAGLKNKGLTLTKISQLIYLDNYTIDLNGKQIRSN